MAATILLCAFFVSGFAGLLYQIVWQRMLTLFGGADLYSVTLIVSAFMGGLGAGSLSGGHIADRLTPRGRLLAFAGCELAVGLFALFSANIFYDGLYAGVGVLNIPWAAVGVIVFFVILWPTFFMGMSLPLLSTAMTIDDRRPARWVPILYGVNTLGGACGSVVAAAVLFRRVDLATAARIGASLSFGCALAASLALPYLSRSRGTPSQVDRKDQEAQVHPDHSGQFAAWTATYALSGFIALSLEIVWFRVLGVILKSNSFTFAHLLGMYLAGIGLGALLANTRVIQSFNPANAFLFLQAAIAPVAVASLGLFLFLVPRLDSLSPLWQYLGRYETLSRQELLSGNSLLIGVYVIAPVWLLGLPTLMMGLSFGCLQRAVQTDVRILGRRIGWLQTANIIGSMTGAVLTGIVLLDILKTTGTLKLLVICSVSFILLSRRIGTGRTPSWQRLVGVAALLVVAYLTPSASLLWSRLHGTTTERVIHDEDGSGLSVLKMQPTGNATIVFANGLGQSTLPYGELHTVLGALPVMVHPKPTAVAVIGLGSGDTLFSVGGRPETRVIDSIEIIQPEFGTLRRLDQQREYPALRLLLRDRRVTHVFTDGRIFLRKGSRRYDVIEADALRPTSAYAGNLYSVEYFELLRERLAPGGIAVTWTPTPRVVASMVAAFPYVIAFDHVAMGSSVPVPFNPKESEGRMRHPATQEYYRRGGIDIEPLLAPYLSQAPASYGPDFDRAALTDVNRDLFPKDEFAIPLLTGGSN